MSTIDGTVFFFGDTIVMAKELCAVKEVTGNKENEIEIYLRNGAILIANVSYGEARKIMQSRPVPVNSL